MTADSKSIKMDPEAKEKLRRTVRFFAETGLNFHLQATQEHGATTARRARRGSNRHSVRAPAHRLCSMEGATAETIARIKKLGGAISVQDRLALTGERYVDFGAWNKHAMRRRCAR